MVREVRCGAVAGALSVFLGACSGQSAAPASAETRIGRSAQAATVPYDYEFEWVVANNPTGSYAPEASFAAGPTANGGPTMVNNTRAGLYRVDLPGLGENGGGNVQVSAYGGGADRCKVAWWTPSILSDWTGAPLPGTSVTVACHDTKGEPADSPFILPFHAGYGAYSAAPGENDGLTYLWSNELTGTFAPATEYQWSTSSQANQVQEIATGTYQVTLAGLGAVGGSVLVTAYGTGSEYCKVAYWYPSGGDTVVEVLCFDGTGQPVNTLFSLSFRQNTTASQNQWGDAAAYVWANDPSSASYTPYATYSYSQYSALPFGITRQSVGAYEVSYPISWPHFPQPVGIFPLVTSYGAGAEYCKVPAAAFISGWGSWSAVVPVGCFLPNGASADTQFDGAIGVNEAARGGGMPPPIALPPD